MLHTLTTLGSTWRFAATLQAVVSVRLRHACRNCAIGLDLAPSVGASLVCPTPPRRNCSERTCGTCWGTGYHGRALLAETVFLNSAMRESLLVGTDEAELMELAREDGFHTLWSWVSLQQGKTLDEIRTSCRRGDRRRRILSTHPEALGIARRRCPNHVPYKEMRRRSIPVGGALLIGA